MPDLPDYYTQAAIAEAEAAAFKGGLEANRPDDPVSRDLWLATDTIKLFYCVTDGTWLDITHACLLLAGGTMTGAIAMGTNKITGLGDPTAAQDAATRAYVLARVALRLALTGGTMSGNIVMGGNKLTGLGAPAAQDDSLRYGRAEIRNAEIAAAAAIVYSKLNLTGALKKGDIEAAAGIEYSKLALTGAIKKGDIEAAAGIEYSKLALAASIVMADLAAAIQNAANGIVVLDASADVPLAQIPDTLTGKDADTVDGDDLSDIETTMDGKITTHDGLSSPHSAAGFAKITIAETEVFTGNAPTAWTDLDLNATIGAQATKVMVKVAAQYANVRTAFRKNGDTDEFYDTTNVPMGVAAGENVAAAYAHHVVYEVLTDANGVVEWKSQSAEGRTIDVMEYTK